MPMNVLVSVLLIIGINSRYVLLYMNIQISNRQKLQRIHLKTVC
jgi:hypothetical protein